MNGHPAAERLAVRRPRSAPIVAALEERMPAERPPAARIRRGQGQDYMLDRWSSFARFFDDGCVCMTDNASERAVRGLALGRKAWLFAGSDDGD